MNPTLILAGTFNISKFNIKFVFLTISLGT